MGNLLKKTGHGLRYATNIFKRTQKRDRAEQAKALLWRLLLEGSMLILSYLVIAKFIPALRFWNAS